MDSLIIQVKDNEHGLFYSQADKDKALGCIGHLRGDFGSGTQFYTSWFDHLKDLKNDAFKQELDKVVNFLRDNPQYPVLKSRADMSEFCYKNPNSRIPGAWHKDVFGFKLETETHSYYLRCFPHAGDYNFYIYCYDNRYLLMELSGKTDLPEKCFSVLPSSGNLILIRRGESGYTPFVSDKATPKETRMAANDMNEMIGVTKAQEAAMLAGSMFGWNVPAANPRNYDEKGNPIKPKNKDYER